MAIEAGWPKHLWDKKFCGSYWAMKMLLTLLVAILWRIWGTTKNRRNTSRRDLIHFFVKASPLILEQNLWLLSFKGVAKGSKASLCMGSISGAADNVQLWTVYLSGHLLLLSILATWIAPGNNINIPKSSWPVYSGITPPLPRSSYIISHGMGMSPSAQGNSCALLMMWIYNASVAGQWWYQKAESEFSY